MLKVSSVLHIAVQAFRRWLRNSRLVVVFLLLIVVKNIVVDPLVSVSVETGHSLSLFEPFIALSNSGVILMAMPLCFLVLMADYPENSTFDMTYGMRTTKRCWIMGQILFSLFAVTGFTLFMLLSSVLMSAGHAEWMSEFSYGITHYVTLFPERAYGLIYELVPSNLYNQMTLFQAVGRTFLLLVLYLFLLTSVLLLFTIIRKRWLGLIINFIILAGGVVTTAAKSRFMWFFPMAHTIPWLHYREYYRKQVFPLWGSYLYLTAFVLLLLMLSIIFAHRFEFEKDR